MCNGCELTAEEKQRIKDKSIDFYQRYSKEEILDIRNSLAAYAYMPVSARRAIDQLVGDLEKAYACIEHAVRIYGKYGCIINEPGNAGVWRSEAGEIINSIK